MVTGWLCAFVNKRSWQKFKRFLNRPGCSFSLRISVKGVGLHEAALQIHAVEGETEKFVFVFSRIVCVFNAACLVNSWRASLEHTNS